MVKAKKKTPVERVIDKFRNTPVSKIVTHKEMLTITRQKTKTEKYYNIIGRAKILLEKFHRIVVESVYTKGYQVLPDGSVPAHTQKDARTIYRKSARGIVKLNTIDFSKLTTPQKRLYNTQSRLFVLTCASGDILPSPNAQKVITSKSKQPVIDKQAIIDMIAM